MDFDMTVVTDIWLPTSCILKEDCLCEVDQDKPKLLKGHKYDIIGTHQNSFSVHYVLKVGDLIYYIPVGKIDRVEKSIFKDMTVDYEQLGNTFFDPRKINQNE